MDRRQFFRRMTGAREVVYPPGASVFSAFTRSCKSCGACVTECPTEIISISDNNLPVVNFKVGGCRFCFQCNEVCKGGPLDKTLAGHQAWPWRATIGDKCLERKGIVCRACETFCDEDAIAFRPALGGKTDVAIKLEQCTGCGSCISGCPSNAIDVFQPESLTAQPLEAAS